MTAAAPTVLTIRDAPDFLARLEALGPGYVPEWLPDRAGVEVALAQIVARYLQSIARRLEQAPAKNELAFLNLLGVRLVPAQPARAPLAVELAETAADVALPAGTRVAASPPPGGGGGQISYETERPIRLAAARLLEAVSLWPGRDQYVDHDAALQAKQSFRLFDSLGLQGTPHVIYVAHPVLLALAGQSAVTVTFELTTGGSDSLDIRWEYWDGGVWRPFRDTRPACSNGEPEPLDSTSGLRTSGAYRLETDCAETAATTIAGFESFWVRGRLDETLPADPARVLPEVEAIRLSTQIARSYASIFSTIVRAAESVASSAPISVNDALVVVRILDAAGVPLEGVSVSVEGGGAAVDTDESGTVNLVMDAEEDGTIVAGIDGFAQSAVVHPPAETPIEVVLALDMPALDQAVADTVQVDLTKPFFPFGVQPLPGAAFYFSHAEALSKPGAKLLFYVQPTVVPPDPNAAGNDQALDHVVSWEYWNGRAWRSILTETGPDVPGDFTALGTVELTVPADIAPTTVNDQEALWMRVRLVGGGYGVSRSLVVEHTTLHFFVPLPPALADLRIGYAWQDGPHAPEHVVAYNDFRYEDRTLEATWPGKTFQPFVPIGDSTPGLYLGFDRPLPNDNVGIYFDVLEESGDSEGPTLIWEYWNGFVWDRVAVDDETRNLRVPGIVSLVGPADMQPLARFDEPRWWLRARLNEDGPPGEPLLERVAPNAVWVVHRQTVVDEPIGAATGQAGQTLAFRQLPVLPGQTIEVRELTGLRANVEWRILASELLPQPAAAIQVLETALAAEGPDTEVSRGPLRLRRDRLKHVTEAWVLWEERPTLFLSGPADRHYALDHARGRLHFGDGERGRVPPVGALVAARQYQTGGGRAGNVAAGAVSQLLGPIGGVEEVANVAPAEGGADTETAEAVALRGPHTVRARGRAVGADELETMAREASPSVAVARVLPARDPTGRPAPGWVTLVIIPASAEPRPFPTFGLRQQVRRYIEERASADISAAAQIAVVGPAYQPVDVAATVVLLPGVAAGGVEQAAFQAISTFLHPLLGGPGGQGWTPGEAVFLSDLAAVVERVAGVDYCSDLALLRNGVAVGERLAIAAGCTPVAGDLRVSVVEG